MGTFRSVAMPSVQGSDIERWLATEGETWQSVCHVTATVSLAAALREYPASTGARAGDRSVAMPIATLSDLIVMPHHPHGYAIPTRGFPSPSGVRIDAKGYLRDLGLWQNAATGRRMRMSLAMDASLRKSLRGMPPGIARVLRTSRRELTRSILSLIAAGLSPDDLDPQSEIAASAVSVWSAMEHDVPALTTVRDLLWFDPDRLDDPADSEARHVEQALTRALSAAFGAPNEREGWLLLHHGFYFYTPPQWAIFQLLRKVENVDQVFVIHDDGRSPAFDTWRQFFHNSNWLMPPIEWTSGATTTSPGVAALDDALAGRPVGQPPGGEVVRIVECRNATELVRDLRSIRIADEDLHCFAAKADEVKRHVARLDRETTSESVGLADLPVGHFLLALYGSIEVPIGGRAEVTLTREAVIDIAASGFLGSGLAEDGGDMAALKRAMPFFTGCESSAEWAVRAQALEALVVDEVSRLGSRDESDSDLDRMVTASRNPLRLVPWADLSPAQAHMVRQVVESVAELASRTIERETTSIRDHLSYLRKELEKGLKALPQQQADQVLTKFQSFAEVPGEELDIEGLVDVVRMILGREPDFETDGTVVATPGAIRELRALDAIGFQRVKGEVHLANLADGQFPAKLPSLGWPFSASDLPSHADTFGGDQMAAEILLARARYAGLSDLYLLRLGLDSVLPGEGRITLSWISETAGETRTASSLLVLLSEIGKGDTALRTRTGGIPVQKVGRMLADVSDGISPVTALPASKSNADLATALDRLDRRAASSSRACPRRFAIQWASGRSAAYLGRHHWTLLYGNVFGALVKTPGIRMSPAEAQRLCSDLWRNITPGERASSGQFARVKATEGPSEVWLLTLAGSQTDQANSSTPPEINRAYRAALDRDWTPAVSDVVPEPAALIPAGVQNIAICQACPVRDQCLVAQHK